MNSNPSIDSKIPKAVVSRLSLYLRELQQLAREGAATVSSKRLGDRLGFTASQIRKDFAYFGQFGRPGIGYHCEELVTKIRSILGTDRTWPVVLIGCGNLGQALLGYRGFSPQGFELVAAFDVADELVGRQVGDTEIMHLSRLKEVVQQKKVRVAVLAVPAEAVDAAVDAIIQAGITGILNFAPVTLSLPKQVGLVEVDLARELEQLAFTVLQQDDG